MRRRAFLHGAALLGATGALGLSARSAAAEPPPETTRLRLVRIPSVCQAPQYVAEALLNAEGFTDVQYIPKAGTLGLTEAVASGEANINNHFVSHSILRIEAGDPIVFLGGLHIGCFELFGTERIRTVRDLKGKSVGILELGGAQHAFLSTMAAHVGLDPGRDITWVINRPEESMQLLAERRIDAFLGFPPQPQELKARKIGHVVVNSTLDRPWSQYFCCMIIGNREFVKKHPVATKRALRAIVKANSVCALEPERTARYLVDKGFTPRFDYALDALQSIPYAQWRQYEPEDTIRFYALRLHEAGMIKSSPQKILAQGSDFHFLNELKKELKA